MIDDTIEKVEHSEWASLTFPFVKANGREFENLWGLLCHHQQILSSVLEQYPIQTLEELLSTFSGGKILKHINESLRQKVENTHTINTHLGIYHQYKRQT